MKDVLEGYPSSKIYALAMRGHECQANISLLQFSISIDREGEPFTYLIWTHEGYRYSQVLQPGNYSSIHAVEDDWLAPLQADTVFRAAGCQHEVNRKYGWQLSETGIAFPGVLLEAILSEQYIDKLWYDYYFPDSEIDFYFHTH